MTIKINKFTRSCLCPKHYRLTLTLTRTAVSSPKSGFDCYILNKIITKIILIIYNAYRRITFVTCDCHFKYKVLGNSVTCSAKKKSYAHARRECFVPKL